MRDGYPPRVPSSREGGKSGQPDTVKGRTGGTGHTSDSVEVHLDREGPDPGWVRLPLLSAIDPVGSGDGNRAVGRERTGGSCISESSAEQSGGGGLGGEDEGQGRQWEAAVVP